MGQVSISSRSRDKCQRVDVRKAVRFVFRAVVDTVFKGLDTGDAVLQGAEGLGDLLDLAWQCAGPILEHNNVAECGWYYFHLSTAFLAERAVTSKLNNSGLVRKR